MKSFLFSVLSVTLFVAGVSALTINTPSSVLSCSPLQITFSGGTPPYTITVHDGATPSGPPLQTFSNVTSSPFTWSKVNYPPNTSLGLNLLDSTGTQAQSAPFPVAGTDVSCLNGTATTAAATTPAATTPAATTPAATTPAGTTSRPSGSSSSTSSRAATPNAANGTSTRPSSTTTPNGAMPISVPYGAAGVLGAVVAVVFA